LPDGFDDPRIVMPGVLAVKSPAFVAGTEVEANARRFCESGIDTGFPLIVLVDDSEFTARRLGNWLWVTFTRADPATDVHGIGAFVERKHWGCRGSLVIDARIKPHHAPPLVEDPAITRRVDALAAPGGPLHGIL
jgi:4-hydroxy-3-polyprenylbenzoate decarboxylase